MITIIRRIIKGYKYLNYLMIYMILVLSYYFFCYDNSCTSLLVEISFINMLNDLSLKHLRLSIVINEKVSLLLPYVPVYISILLWKIVWNTPMRYFSCNKKEWNQKNRIECKRLFQEEGYYIIVHWTPMEKVK